MKTIAGAIIVLAAALLISSHSIAHEINRFAAKTVYTHDWQDTVGKAGAVLGLVLLITGLVTDRKDSASKHGGREEQLP